MCRSSYSFKNLENCSVLEKRKFWKKIVTSEGRVKNLEFMPLVYLLFYFHRQAVRILAQRKLNREPLKLPSLPGTSEVEMLQPCPAYGSAVTEANPPPLGASDADQSSTGVAQVRAAGHGNNNSLTADKASLVFAMTLVVGNVFVIDGMAY